MKTRAPTPKAATASDPVKRPTAEPHPPSINLLSLPIHAARRGVATASHPLPHLERVQSAFGHHDVSDVRATVGSAPAALDANAYTIGDRVAFARDPDVHLAAHEAAHVVQQRAGILPTADHEQHADRVADAVARAHSAESLLDRVVPSAAPAPVVQFDRDEDTRVDATLIAILERSVAKGDGKAASARVRDLTAELLALPAGKALVLAMRLSKPKRGDKLAQLFHYKLSSGTANQLVILLAARWGMQVGLGIPAPQPALAAPASPSPDDILADKIDRDEAWGAWGGGTGSMESMLEMDQNTPDSERGFYDSTEFRIWYLQGYRGIARLPDPAAALEYLAAGLIIDPTQRKKFLERFKLSTAGSARSTALDATRVSGNLDAATTALGGLGIDRQRDVAVASGDYGSTTFAEMAKGRKIEKGRYVLTFERWMLDGVEVTQDQWQAAKPIVGADAPHRFQWLEVDLTKGSKRVEKYGFGEVDLPEQADAAVWSRDYRNADDHVLVRETWFHVDPDDVTRGRRMLRLQWSQVGPSVGIDDGHGHVGGDLVAGRMIQGPAPRVTGIRSGRRVPNQPSGLPEADLPAKRNVPTDPSPDSTTTKKPTNEADETTTSSATTPGGTPTDAGADATTTGKTASSDADASGDSAANTKPAPTPESTKTHPKRKGAIFVAGRWTKARIATATHYVWRNWRMRQGNFVVAKLDADGELTVEIKASGKDELRVGGAEMLDDVFDHFGSNIKTFRAQWPRRGTFTTNHDEYRTNVDEKNLSPTKAAEETWTGRYLAKKGFRPVSVDDDRDLGLVEAIFVK